MHCLPYWTAWKCPADGLESVLIEVIALLSPLLQKYLVALMNSMAVESSDAARGIQES